MRKQGRIKNVKKTTVDGIKFDSKREADRYCELKLLERAGRITHLVLQPVYPFIINDVEIRYPPNKLGRKGPIMKYKADFEYIDNTNSAHVIEDAKGHLTDAYKIKRAIMYSMGYTINEV